MSCVQLAISLTLKKLMLDIRGSVQGLVGLVLVYCECDCEWVRQLLYCEWMRQLVRSATIAVWQDMQGRSLSETYIAYCWDLKQSINTSLSVCLCVCVSLSLSLSLSLSESLSLSSSLSFSLCLHLLTALSLSLSLSLSEFLSFPAPPLSFLVCSLSLYDLSLSLSFSLSLSASLCRALSASCWLEPSPCQIH